MRVSLVVVVALVLAGTAAAAGSGTVTTTLRPDKAGKASTLSVTATGPFSASGIPTSAMMQVQKGFRSSPRSVAVLCSSSQESSGSCPVQSKIGSGSAQVTGTLAPFPPQQDTLTFDVFLGVPQQSGDIAAVVIAGSDSLFHQSAHATGRLFKSGGGLELLFSQFPTVSGIPPGTQITLDRLQLSAGAKRMVRKGKGKHRRKVQYALITNPKKCTGQWTGSFTFTFSSGDVTRSLSTPCRK